jgi:hypothetical protein
VPQSVLDAIKQGYWDFEPQPLSDGQYDATRAMPGTDEKLEILAERLRLGLPLWHPADVLDFDDLHSERRD